MASVTDPSIPSSDGTCHYLGLSQELRYEIYRYVLTGDEEFITYEMLKEINQLQYVSKQLRAETVGLTLKFNKCVKFWSAHDIIKWNRTSNHSCLVGVTQAVNFLWACSPASARKLATVLIEVPSPRTHSVYKLPLADISGPLSSICRSRTHNHTLVKIRIASWDFKDVAKIRTFIRTGKFLEGKWVAKSPGVSSNVRYLSTARARI
ncbi:hypothetical protein BU16DRAFT_609932 [Lophium mytilinum]|uniref:Uncharacterized protein n=1 Tax=Lophium mytilinum TaxID=390894 RepID=A0A6A6QTY0_9PEZI|nr:hypothetical protein BU16DRAFT_609932 [Lophium mytilinum]